MGANVKREEPGYRNYIGKVKGKVEWSVREDKVRESDRQKPDDSRLRPRFDDTRPERYSPESRRKRSPSRERPARRLTSRERPDVPLLLDVAKGRDLILDRVAKERHIGHEKV